MGAALAQGWANLMCPMLDAVIIFQFLKYEHRYILEKVKRFFVLFSTLALATCCVMQFTFFFHFEGIPVAKYSAFAQNAAISITFLAILFSCSNTRGQTMLMALCKWIGNLAPAILDGIIEKINIYMLIMGTVYFVFGILYIFALSKWKKEEQLS